MGSKSERNERYKDVRKKIRVLVKFSDEILFESFSYDISQSGVFIIVNSLNPFKHLITGMELECYIEYNFDKMLKAKGIVSRIIKPKDATDQLASGFALAFSEISDDNKDLLEQMINDL